MSTNRREGRGAKQQLKIIPLGGLHEIGHNLTLLAYKNDILEIYTKSDPLVNQYPLDLLGNKQTR